MVLKYLRPPWWFPNLLLAILSSYMLSHSFDKGPLEFEVLSEKWILLTGLLHIPYAIIFTFLFAGFIEHVGYFIRGRSREEKGSIPSPLPTVCVQLPMFNEHEVAKRAIEASCALDWPHNLLEIQVLDCLLYTSDAADD